MPADKHNGETVADATETNRRKAEQERPDSTADEEKAHESDGGDKLHEFADEGYEAARRLAADAYEKAQKYAEELEADVRSYVRREPLKAVAIAFVVGYVAARLLRR